MEKTRMISNSIEMAGWFSLSLAFTLTDLLSLTTRSCRLLNSTWTQNLWKLMFSQFLQAGFQHCILNVGVSPER